ncbi:hypothetical protein BU17DRAFT_70304 [Hysterangium stoloniferum]|nr:hypothetical protein BU17DRAFT_70304 [Hysterangium stoloniferum]
MNLFGLIKYMVSLDHVQVVLRLDLGVPANHFIRLWFDLTTSMLRRLAEHCLYFPVKLYTFVYHHNHGRIIYPSLITIPIASLHSPSFSASKELDPCTVQNSNALANVDLVPSRHSDVKDEEELADTNGTVHYTDVPHSMYEISRYPSPHPSPALNHRTPSGSSNNVPRVAKHAKDAIPFSRSKLVRPEVNSGQINSEPNQMAQIPVPTPQSPSHGLWFILKCSFMTITGEAGGGDDTREDGL